MLIGIGYKARSGKDMVAEYLADKHHFRRLAFADPLKKACKEIFGWPHWDLSGKRKAEVDEWWSATLGREITPRMLLQEVGTDLFRGHFCEDIWLHVMARRLDDLNARVPVVIPDVRFVNEAVMIKARGGLLWKIDRPEAGAEHVAEAAHESETALSVFKGWDAVLVNDGTPRQLFEKVGKALVKEWPHAKVWEGAV